MKILSTFFQGRKTAHPPVNKDKNPEFYELTFSDGMLNCEAFLPGVSAGRAFKVLTDYENHKEINPSIIDSRILSVKDGITFSEYHGKAWKYEYTMEMENRSRTATRKDPSFELNWRLKKPAPPFKAMTGKAILTDHKKDGSEGCLLRYENESRTKFPRLEPIIAPQIEACLRELVCRLSKKNIPNPSGKFLQKFRQMQNSISENLGTLQKRVKG